MERSVRHADHEKPVRGEDAASLGERAIRIHHMVEDVDEGRGVHRRGVEGQAHGVGLDDAAFRVRPGRHAQLGGDFAADGPPSGRRRRFDQVARAAADVEEPTTAARRAELGDQFAEQVKARLRELRRHEARWVFDLVKASEPVSVG